MKLKHFLIFFWKKMLIAGILISNLEKKPPHTRVKYNILGMRNMSKAIILIWIGTKSGQSQSLEHYSSTGTS